MPTIEAQIKQLYNLQLLHKDFSPEGRKPYDERGEEIRKLYKVMPKIDFETLFGKDFQNNKKYLYLKTGIIDLDQVEMIQIESENRVSGEDTIEKVKTFLTKHPDFCLTSPYEGNVTYLFSKRPEVLEIKDVAMLHRGACGIVNNCPKNVLIIMDLD